MFDYPRVSPLIYHFPVKDDHCLHLISRHTRWPKTATTKKMGSLYHTTYLIYVGMISFINPFWGSNFTGPKRILPPRHGDCWWQLLWGEQNFTDFELPCWEVEFQSSLDIFHHGFFSGLSQLWVVFPRVTAICHWPAPQILSCIISLVFSVGVGVLHKKIWGEVKKPTT